MSSQQAQSGSPQRWGVVIGAVAVLTISAAVVVFRQADRPDVPRPAPIAAVAAADSPAVPEPAKVVPLYIVAAPKAQVTFRRRVSPLPYSENIVPTNILEMIEVSAPGRQTVRYWITLDRPTTLHAHLPVGTGFVDATAEETLIALGEAETPVMALPTVADQNVNKPAPRIVNSAPAQATRLVRQVGGGINSGERALGAPVQAAASPPAEEQPSPVLSRTNDATPTDAKGETELDSPVPRLPKPIATPLPQPMPSRAPLSPKATTQL